MKQKKSSASYLIVILCIICSQYVNLSTQFEIDSIGRVVRGHLGTLYDLRNKLGGSSSSQASPSSSSNSGSATSSSSSSSASPAKKESRGYAFHYSSADISHPVYSSSSNMNLNSNSNTNSEFHNRMGKVSESQSSNNKWKNSDKSWDKYAKLAYKTSPTSSSLSSSGSKDSTVNSFNIHQKFESSPSSKKHSSSGSEYSNSHTVKTTERSLPSEVIKTTSLPIVASPTASHSGSINGDGSETGSTSTLNLTPMKVFSQGLNTAVTTVLTQKLMTLLDQEVPPTILNPMKHLVASGNRMVEFWDQRVSARDGKSPGIVEMMGYGLDQLKKFRDGGQPLKTSDEIGEGTSASKTLIQGMLTVKKLTNRVLGYDTDEAAIESRGDYGGYGGGGGHGHVSYGSYGGLDPFSLLAALAFGAFLLQLLLTMMSTSARSLDVSDMNTPLMMSDFHMPSVMTAADKIFGTPTIRSKRDADGEESTFGSIVDKLDGMFKTYQQVSEKPKCIKLYLCRIAVQDTMGDENSLLSQLYMFGLGHLAKDKSLSQFMKSIQGRVEDGEDVNCDKIVKECVPKELQ